MRFAGQVFNKFPEQNDFSEADDYMKRGVERMRPEIQKPVVPGFNTEDLIPTPELPAGTPFNQNDKGRYIQQNPGSGITMLPGGEQGPAQGPNTPIKNYGGQYMPDGTQPTGYKTRSFSNESKQVLTLFVVQCKGNQQVMAPCLS